MPNQRKKGKKLLTVWLSETERIILDEVIKNGKFKDKTDFVIKAIYAEYERIKKGSKK